ncbi:MAG: glycosyltransferase family 4 protein [Anaerolineales bacterium]|nr:glycosyltransferase family 4 protein [Anaerolineales bacterium]
MHQRIGTNQRVGINAHLLSQQASYRSAGIHGYIHNVIYRLPDIPNASDLQFTIFQGKGQVPPHPRFDIIRSSWPTNRPAVRILWEQLVLPWNRVDLLHGMAFVTPVISPWPTVVTVYDLSFIYYPESLTAGRRLYLKTFTRLSCQRARQIIAISSSTRRDLVKQWNLSADKILVAYPGVGDQFRPLPAGEVEAYRRRLGLPELFILYLGTWEPRKNLVRLVQAFDLLRRSTSAFKLVLAGGKGWLFDSILAMIESLNLQDHVIVTGYIPMEDLSLLYNAATLFTYPSIYEGFGLPVIEAMACGTPVVTSNVSSMPEAAGEGELCAGLTINPDDTDGLANAMYRACTDNSLRRQMREKGLRQAANFNWNDTAKVTISAYRRALGVSDG